MNQQVNATSLMSQITAVLCGQLSSLSAPPSTLVVGFSGGVDSGFLLHALNESLQNDSFTLPPVHAVYINHGLSVYADSWQAHCKKFCHQRNIRFSAVHVNVPDLPRTSLEATARDARYEALLEICRRENGALVLGQHQDDQTETLLLALKRGSGPAGLAGMRAFTLRENIPIFRPMLRISRKRIEDAARVTQLSWIEDASNKDNRFDRNFLRNNVIPEMTRRWTHFGDAVAKSAELLQEQNALLSEVTQVRFAQVEQSDGTLLISALNEMTAAWRKAVIRHWLQQLDKSMPSLAQLDEMLLMLTAREDANPFVRTSGYTVRRYNGRLYCYHHYEQKAETTALDVGSPVVLSWWEEVFIIRGEGAWRATPASAYEKLMVLRNPRGKSPRKWFKEWKVPPWLRERVPVLSREGAPVALLLPGRVVMLAESEHGQFQIELSRDKKNKKAT